MEPLSRPSYTKHHNTSLPLDWKPIVISRVGSSPTVDAKCRGGRDGGGYPLLKADVLMSPEVP